MNTILALTLLPIQVGADNITRATPICFLNVFMIAFGEIFLKCSWKNLLYIYISYYFIKVHVKILGKNVVFKIIEIHLQVLLLFKSKRYNV
jgi:hypothetical protein